MFSLELKYAIQIVSALEWARIEGSKLTTADLRRECGTEVMTFNYVILHLNRNKCVDNDLYNTQLVDLSDKSLFDLAEAIGDKVAGTGIAALFEGWSPKHQRKHAAAMALNGKLLDEYRKRLQAISLAELINDYRVDFNYESKEQTKRQNLCSHLT